MKPSEAPENGNAEDRCQAFRLAYGRFVDLFEKVETGIQLVLWHYANVVAPPPPIAFGLFDVDDAIPALRRLLRVRTDVDQTKADDLKAVLGQLDLINAARHQIQQTYFPKKSNAISTTLYGGMRTNGIGLKTNHQTAEGSFNSTEFLDVLCIDLRKILAHFLVRHIDRPVRGLQGVRIIDSTQWRYIPSMPPFTSTAGPLDPDHAI